MTLLIMGCDGASTNVQVLTADASRRIADANTDGSLASDAGATTTDSMIRLADVGNERDGSLRPLENCEAISTSTSNVIVLTYGVDVREAHA